MVHTTPEHNKLCIYLYTHLQSQVDRYVHRNKEKQTRCYTMLSWQKKKKTCIMKWKDKWDLTHGEHISKQVSDSTKTSKYGKWASECLTRLWCNMDFVLIGTRKSLLWLFLRKRTSVKTFQSPLVWPATCHPTRLLIKELYKKSWKINESGDSSDMYNRVLSIET